MAHPLSFNLRSNPQNNIPMKTSRIIVSILSLTAALAYAGPEGADHKHGKKEAATKQEKQPEWAGLFGGASLPVVWQSGNAAMTKIGEAVAAKKTEGVADWAETVHLASHALEDQVKLDDADRAKRLKGALEQAAKIADEVLDAANHNEVDKMADSYRRMNAAWKLAVTRLPKDITEAAPQQVRFAKSAGHAHDEKGDHVPKK